MSRSVFVDKAGATIGGARRYLLELTDYLNANPRPEVQLIGGDRLSSRWLIEREWIARGGERIALNNASFAFPGEKRSVLLRNALHFASEEEFKELGYVPSKHMRRQIPVIRQLARRSDSIIVPCTAMAERVMTHCPELRNKISVRMHPVSARGWSTTVPDQEIPIILVPIVPNSYKRLDLHIPAILRAGEGLNVKVVVTASKGEIPEAEGHPQYQAIGRMSAEDLSEWWGRATAIFFPPTLESFGYALAEARCGGRPVIAPDTRQNQEIAGNALCGYSSNEKLGEAIRRALTLEIKPDNFTFDPTNYFDRLFSKEEN